MSGGSFNYLCYVEDHFGADEIFKRDSDLEDMKKALTALVNAGCSSTSLRDTRLLIECMAEMRKELTMRLKQLSPVWKAVEWERSGDWGMDRVVEAMNQYAIEHGSVIKLVDSDE